MLTKKLFWLCAGLLALTASPSEAAETNLDLSPAKWIWYPSGRTLQNTFILFRKEIFLDTSPAKASGWILADSRYTLYVNGKQIQRGPAPSDPRWQEADPIDLTGLLQKGKNVIGVEVCFFGTGDGTYAMGKPGLLVNLQIDGRPILTDSTWSCSIAHSWQPGQYKRWFLRALQEQFDARHYPYGWQQPDFQADSSWHSAIEVGQGRYSSICNRSSEYIWQIRGDTTISRIQPRSIPFLNESYIAADSLAEQMWIHWKQPAEEYFDMITPNAFTAIHRPVAKRDGVGWSIAPDPRGDAASLTFTFKEQGVGWPRFVIDAPAGTIIEMLVHEAHQKGGPALINSHFNAWTRFICKEGINQFETFDFESFRWMQLHIRNFNRPVRILSVGMNRRIYPFRQEASFTLSDDTIQRVAEATINTLYNCAQETLIDGMARERQQYSGDGSHQLHPLLQTFGEETLAKRFIKTFSEGSAIEGYFMDSWPGWDRLIRIAERQMQLTHWGPILDHSIGFCFDSYYYYLYTGDKEGLREVYPRLLKFFHYLQSLTTDGDLLPADGLGMCSVYIDHQAYKQQRDKQLALNLYTVAMCRHALAPLCRLFNDETTAVETERYAQKMHKACVAKFWDNDQQVFINNLPWQATDGEARYCDRSLSTALLYDLCPEGKIQRSLDILARAPKEMGLSYPCNAVWRQWALIKWRRMDVVLSDLRTRWGRMSSVWENNTLQEFWNALPDSDSQWSHCAVAPLIALQQGVAGVMPLEAGASRLRIMPQPGDLKESRIEVQLHPGTLLFHSIGSLGKRHIELTLPQGVSAELWLDAREKVQLPLLRTEANGMRVYELKRSTQSSQLWNLKLKFT